MDAGLALLLFALVALARFLTRGQLYFADGPRIVDSIRNGTYIIQPPGYWLYAHLGGLFPDPTRGFALLNWIFSAAGASMLFLLCRKLDTSRAIAFAAALAYASIYFNWFAGVTHSSYATQLFFPPLIVLLFLRHRRHPGLLSALGLRRYDRPQHRTAPFGRRLPRRAVDLSPHPLRPCPCAQARAPGHLRGAHALLVHAHAARARQLGLRPGRLAAA